MAKMLVPDEAITAWIDIVGRRGRPQVGARSRSTSTQIAMDSTFMLFGQDGWREHWSKEAYILRESIVAHEATRVGPVRRARLAGPGL